MKQLIVKTQAELDKINKDFDGYIYIEGGSYWNPLVLRTRFEEARVIARESSHVEAWGSSHVVARESSHVVAWESSHVVAWGSSHVEAWGSSHVVAWGSSHVVAWGSSHVVARESSHVEAWGSSHVVAWGSSHVVARESSHVEAWGSSQHKLYGEAMISAFYAKEIVCHGYNVVSVRKENKKAINLVVNSTSTLKIIPTFKATFADFIKRYPVEVKGAKAILYKAVHKFDGKYFSDYDRDFEYKIGKTYKHTNAPKSSGSCAEGLHVAEKSWAKSYGFNWPDYALLECEVPIKAIVVAKDSDGKVRTSQLKVLREVTNE